MIFNRRNLDWWCERGLLTLVVAALVFAPLAFGAVYVWTFLVLQALVIGVALVWLVRLWGGHKPKLLWPPLAWAVAAFVLYALARYFTADIEYVARLELIRVLLYAFLFLAVLSNLYGQDSAETIVYTLTAVAALTASYALAQFAHHSNQVWDLTSPYAGRASGTYINPDHFAGFLELVLPLPLAFLLAGRVGVITRVVLAYATLSILGGLTVTFSRGGWVAATSGVFLLLGLLMCHRNHRLRAFLVLVVLLAGGGVFTARILSTTISYQRRVAKTDDSGPGVLDDGGTAANVAGGGANVARPSVVGRWAGPLRLSVPRISSGRVPATARARPRGLPGIARGLGVDGRGHCFWRHRHLYFWPPAKLAACPPRGE